MTDGYIYADVAAFRLRSALWWAGPVVGLLLIQTYLAFREPIFSPVDELQHTDYVRTIAEEAHLPIYGKARSDLTLLAVYMHEYPAPFSEDGYLLPPYVFAEYEAIQFPFYYVVSAPLYRLLDGDPRSAIYGLRLENVAISAVLLVVLMSMVRRLFPDRPDVAAAAPLALLLMPGLSLRHSQVTNQVLAAVLLTALFALLLRRGHAGGRRMALAEGALFGLAVMTKITVAGAGPSLLVAWASRNDGLRSRLLPGALGFGIVVVPWLIWSLAVYHFPLPWVTTHTNLDLCPCPVPAGIAGWTSFAHDTWVNTVLPFEWAGTALTCNPVCVELSPRTTLMRVALAAFALFIGAALAWGLWALHARASTIWRPIMLAWVAISGVLIGIAGLDISLGRYASTDLREAYVFAAPIVLVIAGFIARVDRRVILPAVVVIIVLWLAVDYQMYSQAPGCPGCPPKLFNHL